MYVVVALETESDTPGVDRVFGGYETYEAADAYRNELRANDSRNPDLWQIAQVEQTNFDIPFGIFTDG